MPHDFQRQWLPQELEHKIVLGTRDDTDFLQVRQSPELNQLMQKATATNVGFGPAVECKRTHFSSLTVLQDQLAQNKPHLMQVMEQSCQHGHSESMPQMLPYFSSLMYMGAPALAGTPHGSHFTYQHAPPVSLPPFPLGHMLPYQHVPMLTGGFQYFSQPHPNYIMHQCPPIPSSSEHSQHPLQWQNLPQKQQHKKELGTRDDTDSHLGSIFPSPKLEESRTEVLAVGFFNEGKRLYISSLSSHDMSEDPLGKTYLPFLPELADRKVTSSRGLLCFMGEDGRIILCNLKTQQLQFLPPPRPCNVECFTKIVVSCGLGYDSISKDYKVIRCCYIYLEREEDGQEVYCDSTTAFELYSFKKKKWENLPIPELEADVDFDPVPVFINSRFHWIMCRDDGVCMGLAVDCAEESFYIYALPKGAKNSKNHLVKIDDDSFGVVLYRREGNYNSFDLWVVEEQSWVHVNDARVVDEEVKRVVGLRNGRQLFLLRKRNNQLVVYDLKKNELKELNIYSDNMMLVSYVPSDTALPDPMPIGSHTNEGWDEYWNNWSAKYHHGGVDDVRPIFGLDDDLSDGESE